MITRDAGADATPDANPTCAGGASVVHFTTDDGVRLEADWLPALRGGRAAVLLHMVPPDNDRRNYPPAFLDALHARGVSVLNVDRRGAGGSGGVAEDAYRGPKGALDAKAAVGFLLASDCAPDASRVAIVGASNGTTTALDYTLLAAANGLTRAAALVFLTGGDYTENQNRVADHLDLLRPLPILFEFADNERDWSAQFEGMSDAWVFDERAVSPGGNAHGTHMFAAYPQSIDFVADFVARHP